MNSYSYIKTNGDALVIVPDVVLKLISSPALLSGDKNSLTLSSKYSGIGFELIKSTWLYLTSTTVDQKISVQRI